MSETRIAGLGVLAFGAVCTIVLVASSVYKIDEGHVGVKTRMGKALSQEGPSGFQFKVPLIEGMHEFDIRERSITGTATASTSNQLSTNIAYSVNWRPAADQILYIYREYGGPDEFASNVIAPRMTQAIKSAIGMSTGEQLAKQRDLVAANMLANIRTALEAYPATFESAQLEDYRLPDWYMSSIQTKEVQREATATAALLLEQQGYVAQKLVKESEANATATENAATAEANAAIAKADSDAYAKREAAKAAADARRAEAEAEADAQRNLDAAGAAGIRLIAEAEADGLRQKAEALKANPQLVEYRWAEGWNGDVPAYITGDGGNSVNLVDMATMIGASR